MKQPKYKEYQAKRAKNERKRQELLPKPWWWLKQREPVARFTLYIGILTFGLVFVGILQWSTIQGQLEEMKSGGKDTRNLALAAKLDQRAWIAAYNFMTDPLEIGHVVHGSVSYVDTGKTPAKNVSPTVHRRFLAQLVANDAELLTRAKDGAHPSPIIGSMYPSIPTGTDISGETPVDADAMSKITAELYVYIWGEVEYSDVFNEPHIMRFCGYRKGMSGGFLQCPFHNEPEYQEKID